MGIRVAIIGLDAATFDIIHPLINKGELPNLARLMEKGTWGSLRSTYPPISAPAWVSCLTGKGPGKHGLFDFRHYNIQSYTGRGDLVNSSDFSGSTVFDILSERGKKVGAFRVPLTYPPWPVNGFMVSGQPTPDRRRAYTYPEDLAEEIGDLHVEGELKKFQYFEEEVYRDHIRMDLERHIEAAVNLLKKNGHDLDLFMMVVNALDASQHRFWKYMDQEYPFPDERLILKYKEVINDFYRQADEGVGRILRVLPPEALVLVMSDHGARLRPFRTVHLNCWLASKGFVQYKSQDENPSSGAIGRKAKEVKSIFQGIFSNITHQGKRNHYEKKLAINWSKTQSIRFPMYPPVDGIAINLVGRQPKGCVTSGDEYEQVRSKILSEIFDIIDPETGEAIVKNAWPREQVYSGPYMDRIPDIVVLLNDRYEGGNGITGPLVTLKEEKDYEVWNGFHSMDGILIASGPHIRSGQSIKGAEITDITPTVLYALNQPIPDYMEGKVLTGLFENQFIKSNQIQTQHRPDPKIEKGKYVLTGGEESEIKEKLRLLGYIE